MSDATADPAVVELRIGGMTCASCAARIEKKLARIPGVSASVNYATGNAHVELPSDTAVGQVIAAVEATGYQAWIPQRPDESTAQESSDPESGEVLSLRQRLAITTVLAVPVLALAMIPVLQFTYWQ